MLTTFKIKNGKIDLKPLWKAKEKFHKDMAKIPFEQKMAIWGEMRGMVAATRKFRLRNMKKSCLKLNCS